MTTLAFISQDCREGSPASGTYGIYEGDFPRRIQYRTSPDAKWNSCPFSEFNKAAMKNSGWINSSEITRMAGEELGITFPVLGVDQAACDSLANVMAKTDEIRTRLRLGEYFVSENPRILLKDGTHIWGDQCWWKIVEKEQEGEALAKLKADCDKFVENFHVALKLYESTTP